MPVSLAAPPPRSSCSSTAHICRFGASLLAGNSREAENSMRPARGGDCSCVDVRQYASASAEAAALADEVEHLRLQGVPLGSMCTLYRCLRLQRLQPHAPLMAELSR